MDNFILFSSILSKCILRIFFSLFYLTLSCYTFKYNFLFVSISIVAFYSLSLDYIFLRQLLCSCRQFVLVVSSLSLVNEPPSFCLCICISVSPFPSLSLSLFSFHMNKLLRSYCQFVLVVSSPSLYLSFCLSLSLPPSLFLFSLHLN